MLIAVVGGSCSGKSTVADKLFNTFNNISTMISMDNFYRTPNEEEKQNIKNYNFDLPTAFDNEHFYQCLLKIKNGESVNIPIYDFKTHSRLNETITVNYNKIIIVEGIFVLEEKRVRDLFDFKVFIDATPEYRLSRRIERDIKERGRQIDGVIQQYNIFVQPSYEKYIRPIQKYCDLIIPNNDHNNFIGVDILTYAIKHKLTL
jgi:uridine kinase